MAAAALSRVAPVTVPAARRGIPGLGEGTPLRVRLVALLLLLVALGLLLAGTIATLALRNSLLGRVDDQLTQFVDQVRHGDVFRGGYGGRPGDDRLPSRYFIAVLGTDGRIAQPVATPQLQGGSTAAPDLSGTSLAEVVHRDLAPFTAPGTTGGRWRTVLIPVQDTTGTVTGSLAVAADLRDVDRPVHNLIVLEVVIGLGVVVVVAGLGYVVVKRSLRGLVEVEEAAAAVAAGDLSRRVPERDPRTEVGSLGSSFNGMVEQVQSAFATRAASEERLRRFVADASHELRTPLTSVRGFAELYRQGAAREPDDVGRLMGRIESESRRMGQLVEDMLTLARLDEQRPLELHPVDLALLAADAVHDARAVRPDRVVALELPAEPVVVQGDEARLRQILGNLVANALTHAPLPARATVRVCRPDAGPYAVLEVADDGPGMPAEVADRIFERFYRADASRTRASGGAGLGLSIAASLTAAHGGCIELDTGPGSGARFRVLLPAPSAASQTPGPT